MICQRQDRVSTCRRWMGRAYRSWKSGWSEMILGGQVIAGEPPLIHTQRHKTALERALAYVEARSPGLRGRVAGRFRDD